MLKFGISRWGTVSQYATSAYSEDKVWETCAQGHLKHYVLWGLLWKWNVHRKTQVSTFWTWINDCHYSIQFCHRRVVYNTSNPCDVWIKTSNTMCKIWS